MMEFEKKLLLSKDEYDYLMDRFGYESPLIKKPITTQINYYFDTDDFSMDRQNTTCRVRLKNEKCKATMKRHSSNGDQSFETEMEMYNGLESNAFTDMGLKLQGKLVTERCVLFKDNTCEAVLDKNEYLGHTDYELEIEYDTGAENRAQTIFRMFSDALTLRKWILIYEESHNDLSKVPSKSNRFFKRKSARKINTALYDNDHRVKDDFYDPDDYMSDYYGAIFPWDDGFKTDTDFSKASCSCFYDPHQYNNC